MELIDVHKKCRDKSFTDESHLLTVKLVLFRFPSLTTPGCNFDTLNFDETFLLCYERVHMNGIGMLERKGINTGLPDQVLALDLAASNEDRMPATDQQRLGGTESTLFESDKVVRRPAKPDVGEHRNRAASIVAHELTAADVPNGESGVARIGETNTAVLSDAGRAELRVCDINATAAELHRFGIVVHV
jgi:hypothetical protein